MNARAANRRATPSRRQPASPIGARAFKAPKVSEMIADWLREHVRRNRLRPGDPLPSEEDLKQRFSASRPTVREAMRILEAQRLVRITRGASGGARYTIPDVGMVAQHTGIYLQAHGASQGDLTAARLSIEPCIIGVIAEQVEAEALSRLTQSVESQAEAVDDLTAFSEQHERFYEILSEICANTTLSMLLLIFRELMHAQTANLGESFQFDADGARKSRRAHIRAKLKLIDLMRAGDRDAAEQWWRRHLRAQMKELAESGRAGEVIRAPA